MKLMITRRSLLSNSPDVTSPKLLKVTKATNYLLTSGVLNIMEKIKSIKLENHSLSEDKT